MNAAGARARVRASRAVALPTPAEQLRAHGRHLTIKQERRAEHLHNTQRRAKARAETPRSGYRRYLRLPKKDRRGPAPKIHFCEWDGWSTTVGQKYCDLACYLAVLVRFKTCAIGILRHLICTGRIWPKPWYQEASDHAYAVHDKEGGKG